MLDVLGLIFFCILLCRLIIFFLWVVVKLDKEIFVIICGLDFEFFFGIINFLCEFYVLWLLLVGMGFLWFKFVGCIFCLLIWEFVLLVFGNKFFGGVLVENVECCWFFRWWLFLKFFFVVLLCMFFGWVLLVV